jgi:hypothetical protein
MDRTLVDIALVLNTHPLIGRVKVFGMARERPDEAETLLLGVIAKGTEIDSAAFLSLRQLLLTTAQRSGDALQPIVLLDKPNGPVWVPKPATNLWEKRAHAQQLAAVLRQGEAFEDWFGRIIAPRLTSEGHSRPSPVTPRQLRTLRADIVQHLDPQWLEPAYRDHWSLENPTAGFCSLAAEAAFFELGGGPAGWKGMVQREPDNQTHWWIEHAHGLRFDPTDSQYREAKDVPPYERGLIGRACGFMGIRRDPDNRWGFGRRPGTRAAELLSHLRRPAFVAQNSATPQTRRVLPR